ncbi:MAG: type II/IV secretion system protein [Candidatus Liptonbacteria bacterium]|nr:type II/IV secretion system protein [Candidatus Liptonbacteria bacterium]
MMQARPQEIDEKLAQLRREGEERDARRIAEQRGLPYMNLVGVPVELDAIRLVPEAESRSAEVVVIEKKRNDIAVAAVDPETDAARAILERLRTDGYELRIFIASRSGLEHAWTFYAYVPKEREKITEEIVIASDIVDTLSGRMATLSAAGREIGGLTGASPISDALARILVGAVALRSSDIHMEAAEHGIRIRYRIDGVLHDVVPALPRDLYLLLLSRIKLVSKLKLNVTAEPQDGRFTIQYGSRQIDMRVSTTPSEYGETVVMRILDASVASLELDDLGFRADDLAIAEEELRKPNGMILTTGPTGSGKTTTLYAFLRYTRSSETKTITIEDPIEYRLEGIEQTQVDSDAGYTFATGLRSIMRQDPDVILVGEIRDGETADIAIQAALTGHLVFSTVHANESVGAVARLTNLHVIPSAIASAVNLIIAQRLVRRVCPSCRELRPADAAMVAATKAFLSRLPARVDKAAYAASTIPVTRGCAACGESGYAGRVGIYELFRFTDAVKEMIVRAATEQEIARHLAGAGMVTMQEDGVLKALAGVTTLEEVARVTGPIALFARPDPARQAEMKKAG